MTRKDTILLSSMVINGQGSLLHIWTLSCRDEATHPFLSNLENRFIRTVKLIKQGNVTAFWLGPSSYPLALRPGTERVIPWPLYFQTLCKIDRGLGVWGESRESSSGHWHLLNIRTLRQCEPEQQRSQSQGRGEERPGNTPHLAWAQTEM